MTCSGSAPCPTGSTCTNGCVAECVAPPANPDLAAGIIATTPSPYGPYDGTPLTDGNDSTSVNIYLAKLPGSNSLNGELDNWQIDLGSALGVGYVRIYQAGNGGNQDLSAQSLNVDYSYDGVTWLSAAVGLSGGQGNEVVATFPVVYARYWRVVCVYDQNDHWFISTIELRAGPPGPVPVAGGPCPAGCNCAYGCNSVCAPPAPISPAPPKSSMDWLLLGLLGGGAALAVVASKRKR